MNCLLRKNMNKLLVVFICISFFCFSNLNQVLAANFSQALPVPSSQSATNANDANSIVKNIVEIIVAMTAIAALVISIKNIKVDETKTISENISKSRIEWMNNFRKSTELYIEHYTKKNANKRELFRLHMNIELYLRNGVKIYTPFQSSLTKCTQEPYSEDNLRLMVEKAQELQNDVWQRIKRESGISYSNEKAIKSKLKKNKVEKENVNDVK